MNPNITLMKRLKEFPDYWANDKGEISYKNNCDRWRSGTIDPETGYRSIKVTDINGQSKTRQVHRLIAGAFHGIPDIDEQMFVLHKNLDCGDNRLSNIGWCTKEQLELWEYQLVARNVEMLRNKTRRELGEQLLSKLGGDGMDKIELLLEKDKHLAAYRFLREHGKETAEPNVYKVKDKYYRVDELGDLIYVTPVRLVLVNRKVVKAEFVGLDEETPKNEW